MRMMMDMEDQQMMRILRVGPPLPNEQRWQIEGLEKFTPLTHLHHAEMYNSIPGICLVYFLVALPCI
jgi:hypothetical protein